MSFFEKMTAEKAKMLSPLVLAFIGDAVMTLYVKEYLAKSSDAKAGKLHIAASKIVCSEAQADLLDKIYETLTETEKGIFLRCRNAKYNSVSKNGTIADYKKASGLEAVLGYNYLIGDMDRCGVLLKFALPNNN